MKEIVEVIDKLSKKGENKNSNTRLKRQGDKGTKFKTE